MALFGQIVVEPSKTIRFEITDGFLRPFYTGPHGGSGRITISAPVGLYEINLYDDSIRIRNEYFLVKESVPTFINLSEPGPYRPSSVVVWLNLKDLLLK